MLGSSYWIPICHFAAKGTEWNIEACTGDVYFLKPEMVLILSELSGQLLFPCVHLFFKSPISSNPFIKKFAKFGQFFIKRYHLCIILYLGKRGILWEKTWKWDLVKYSLWQGSFHCRGNTICFNRAICIPQTTLGNCYRRLLHSAFSSSLQYC